MKTKVANKWRHWQAFNYFILFSTIHRAIHGRSVGIIFLDRTGFLLAMPPFKLIYCYSSRLTLQVCAQRLIRSFSQICESIYEIPFREWVAWKFPGERSLTKICRNLSEAIAIARLSVRASRLKPNNYWKRTHRAATRASKLPIISQRERLDGKCCNSSENSPSAIFAKKKVRCWKAYLVEWKIIRGKRVREDPHRVITGLGKRNTRVWWESARH